MAVSSESAAGPDSDGQASGTPARVSTSVDPGRDFAGDERRRHVRHALKVDGEVGVPDGASRECQIRDFCVGGLFMDVKGANGEGINIGGRSRMPGDEVIVRFSAELGSSTKAFEVKARVARVLSGGMGVAFIDPNPKAIQALGHLANLAKRARALKASAPVEVAKEDVPAAVMDVAGAGRLITAFKQRSLAFLESSLAALFEHTTDNLFNSARRTKDRDEQSVLFDAIQELEGMKEPVQKAFLDAIGEQLEHLGEPLSNAGTLASDTGTLDVELVDTGTFEDWVAVKDIITRAEPHLAERQQEIADRLGEFVGATIDDENNPVGLTGIGLTFHDAIQNLGASRTIRQTMLASFEDAVVANLSALYDDLIHIVSDRDAGSDQTPIASDPQQVTSAKRDTAPSDDPADAPSPVEQVESKQVSPTVVGTQDEFGDEKPASVLGLDPSAVTPPPAITGDALYTARSLLLLERQAKLSDRLPTGFADLTGAQPSPPAGMRSKALDEVIDALSILQRSPKFAAVDEKGPLGLKDRLMTTWRAAGLRVADGDVDAVEVISNLLDAILDDSFVSQRVKGYLRRLAIPLVKVALQDDTFFKRADHPARMAVNQLGLVEAPSNGDSGANDPWHEAVDPLVDRIVNGYERDDSVFAEVLSELDTIIERQHLRFNENVSRVVQERKQQQAAINARRKPEDGGNGADSERSDDHMPTEWQRWLSRVEHLQAGDVVFVDKNGERPDKLNLVWVSDDRGSFLFVDDSGAKASTLTQQELAMQFRRGTARVLDASDLPIVDRGIYRLLNGLHTRLARKASHDGLTGVLNRKAFEASLNYALTDAVRMGTTHTLCVLELDEFQTIAEKCGRKAGKGLLRKLARVLEKHAGNKGVVGRLRRGRFAMLLNNCDLEEGRSIADRQRRSMEKSRCVWHGDSFQLTISVGMVMVDATGVSVTELIKSASAGFEKAHDDGGNRIEVVGDSEQVPTGASPTVVQILESNRLQLRCQRVTPIGLDTSAKAFFEILLGVKDESGELTMPRDFIQAAERNNEMHEVDRWVIRSALDWMAKNRANVDAAGGYSINLSGLTLGDDSLLRYVLERLTESQVPPAKVVFEVTESAAIDTLSVAVNFIHTLKEYGCRFALDDFGTGDASFAYLKTLPIDFVKIDGSLVRDIVDSPKDFALVKSINEIGHFLGKKTIAEFVETDDILTRLRQIGVDYAQGYGIEAPFVL